MGLIVKMPMINANDATAELVSWQLPDGAAVRKGDVLCVVETTKSAVDVVADAAGFLRCLAEAGAPYAIGHPIGFLAGAQDEALPDLRPADPPAAAAVAAGQARWTKKAGILAARLGVDLAALALQHPDLVVGEALVLAASAASQNTAAVPPEAGGLELLALAPNAQVERVLILGGGGGASLVLDILGRSTHQVAVGILDNDPAKRGQSLQGVPIVGGFELALALWQQGGFDALISTVVRDVGDRAAIFDRFSGLGMRFTNIIDPAVRIGAGVSLGQGNLIIYGGYLAADVRLGHNNFLAAGTYIEHHSAIGSHCTFGPRTSLSGQVQVGDRVKFGTQVAVEPQLRIGANATIASGVVLTTHVPAGTIVKSASNPVFRHAQ